MSDFIKQNSIEISFKLREPWVILTKIEQQIKDKIEKYGVPLLKWDGIKINRGILTGCNEAFIIDETKRNEILRCCESDDERRKTDEIIRPILRGRDIKQGSYEWAGLYIINTHNGYRDSSGRYINRIDIKKYPSLKDYMDTHYDALKNREDQGDTPYNLRSCAYMDDFDKQIIVWQRITQKNNFCITKPGMLVLDSTAFLSTDSFMNSLLYQLNSKLFYYWMRLNVHEYGESGFRLSNQYVSIYPALMKEVKTDEELYRLYDFTKDEIKIIESKK